MSFGDALARVTFVLWPSTRITSGAFPFVGSFWLARQDARCLAGTFFPNRMISELSRRKTPSHMRRGRNRLSAPVPRWKNWGRLRCGGTEQYRIPFLALDQGNKRPLLLPFAAAHRTQEQANNLVPPLSPPCLLPFSSQGNNRAVLLPFAATAKTRSQITRPAGMADP